MGVKIIHDFRTELPVPSPPKMPSKADQERSERQEVRYRMLQHKFDTDAAEFFRTAYGEDNAKTMGIPDTTLAALPAQTRQLTVPGLYGKTPDARPETADADSPEVQRMLHPQTGALARARYWSMMGEVMFYTVGIGNFALRLNAVKRGGEWYPTLRHAPPHHLVVWCDESDPMRPVRVAERRIRTVNTGSLVKTQWYWDVFDISDPANPTFQILSQDPEDKRDYVSVFFPQYSGYEWRSPEGEPYIPFLWYHAVLTGNFWHEYRPALLHGTLRGVANWTMTSKGALWSQGNHNIIGGVDPATMAFDQRLGQKDREQEHPFKTFTNTPGTVWFVPVEDEKQMQHFEMKTGVDLSKMLDFANTYNMNLAITDGIMPSDATRRSANPTSGAALAINQSDKRAFAAAVTPQFNHSDSDAIQKIGWLMSGLTGQLHQAEGYHIGYAPIPLTPSEQQDQRNQLQWEEERGQRSKVATHIALNPGTTREQAIDAVVQAAVDEAAIEQRIAEKLEAEGLGVNTKDETQVLNGAQIQALQGIVGSVAAGEIPRDSGIEMIAISFPLSQEQATKLMADAGDGFQPLQAQDSPPQAPPSTQPPLE